MDINNFTQFAPLAFLGTIAVFYKQVQGAVIKIFSIFIRTDEIDGYQIAYTSFTKILAQSKIIRWGNMVWKNFGWYGVKKYNLEVGLVGRKESTLLLLYKNKIPIILKKTESGYKVTYLYKTFGLKAILEVANEEVIDERRKEIKASEQSNDYYLSEFSGEDYKPSDSSSPKEGGSTEQGVNPASNNYYFYESWLREKCELIGVSYSDIGYNRVGEKETYYWSKEALKLKDEIKYWAEHAKWFVDRGIIHKRGAVLHGAAGTGKSKMVLEIAKTLGIPLRKINISNMTDKEFVNVYNNGGHKYAILLLEDIDVSFEGRKNKLAENCRTKNLLSFDTLINTIGGVKQNNGIFLIITTNNLTALDPALIRPGRCDVKIEVGPLDEEGRRFIATNVLRDWPLEITRVVQEWEGATAAEFENNCISLALNLFYEQRKDLT